MARRLLPLALAVVLALAACAPTEIAIPTVIMIPTMPPDQASTATAAAYATQLAPPTLPPTWTPTPVPASPTPEVIAGAGESTSGVRGRFVFVLEGAIQSVNADGTGYAALTTPLDVRDLALSPDQQTVAFVAQAAASTRELFVLDLASGVSRQVTRLGFEEMVDPSWHPDGNLLVVAAAPTVGGARNVYTVRPDGTSLTQVTSLVALDPVPTPSGEEQGLVLSGVGLSDPIFTPDGSGVIFAAPALTMLDLATNLVTPLTILSTWGNDTSPRWRPGSTELVYIRPQQGDLPGGLLHGFDLNTLAGESVPPVVVSQSVQEFAFSGDGRFMVFASGYGVYLRDFDLRALRELAGSADVLPSVAINREGTYVAYLGNEEEEGPPQLVIVARSGQKRQVVVELPDGAFWDLRWVEAE